jgi:hypothetical protein
MDVDLKDQLISTIMKTFAYSKQQADYLFIQLMNCVSNKDLVRRVIEFFGFYVSRGALKLCLLVFRYPSIDWATRTIKKSTWPF